jgi:hypothetical protein
MCNMMMCEPVAAADFFSMNITFRLPSLLLGRRPSPPFSAAGERGVRGLITKARGGRSIAREHGLSGIDKQSDRVASASVGWVA